MNKRDQFILQVRLAVSKETAYDLESKLLHLRYKISRGKNRAGILLQIENRAKVSVDHWKNVPVWKPRRKGDFCIEFILYRQHQGFKGLADQLEEQLWSRPSGEPQAATGISKLIIAGTPEAKKLDRAWKKASTGMRFEP